MRKINIGDKFGLLEVIGPSDRPHYIKCRCSCGVEKEVRRSYLLSGGTKSCGHLAKEIKKDAAQVRSKKHLQKVRENTIGKTINGLKIVDVLPSDGRGLRYKAVCPSCGQSFITARIKNIKTCKSCNENADLLGKLQEHYAKEGSLVTSVKSRISGHVNSNSTTHVNGVSKMSNGKYRAYINFKRKQYYIGSFETIDDAIAARKAAEKEIFVPYLERNADAEEEARIIAERLRAERERVDVDGIISAYKSSPEKPFVNISVEFGVSVTIVKRVLIGTGLYSTKTSEKVCELLKNGCSEDEIAKKLGILKVTVQANSPLKQGE